MLCTSSYMSHVFFITVIGFWSGSHESTFDPLCNLPCLDVEGWFWIWTLSAKCTVNMVEFTGLDDDSVVFVGHTRPFPPTVQLQLLSRYILPYFWPQSQRPGKKNCPLFSFSQYLCILVQRSFAVFCGLLKAHSESQRTLGFLIRMPSARLMFKFRNQC
jgi:hypothetical protein